MKKLSTIFILLLVSSAVLAQNPTKLLDSISTKDKLFSEKKIIENSPVTNSPATVKKNIYEIINQSNDYNKSKPKKIGTKVKIKEIYNSPDTLPNKDKTKSYSVQKNNGSIYIRFTDKNTVSSSDFFIKMKEVFDISSDDSIGFNKKETDNLGYTHYRFQQYYKGIAVMGGQYLLHEKNSRLTSANGHFYPGIKLPSKASISPQSAIDLAKKYMGAKKYMWEIPEEEQFLKKEKNDSNATYYPKPSLIIAAKNGIYTNENFRLCYKLTIAASDPYQIYDYYIDANTGELVNKITQINDGCFHTDKKKVSQSEIELIKNESPILTSSVFNSEQVSSTNSTANNRDENPTADISATANTLYSGTKTITTDSYNGSYRLRETTRPIQTFNMKNGTSYSNAVDFINATTTWNTPDIVLDSVKIMSVNNSWQDVLGEQISNGGAPDLYINIKDANANIIWTNSDNYIKDKFPPISINTSKILLIPGLYVVEIYDYDATSSDDLLGSFSFNTLAGVATVSSNGTSINIYKSSRNNPALDVHWGMEKTYDFYLNQLGRNSFDNSGGMIKNYVHKDIAWNNANWNRTVMSYGDGDNQRYSPLVSIDVVGHEFTHAVVDYCIFNSSNEPVGLIYQNESGALNESFADILGTAIEFYGSSSPNWLMGESFSLQSPGFMRSMSNPKSKYPNPQPDTYQGDNWHPLSNNPDFYDNDYGGVHFNSGVQNYWFYLLSQGGSGTNDLGNSFSVSGIGITNATKIAYYNLTHFLTYNATYYDSYVGSLQAAEALFGNPSVQYSAVQNAWYAVGIGNDPTTYCSGTTELTASSGSFSDGSGLANYNNNANCKWVIAPPAATKITLNFTSFSTEDIFDTVNIYDGPDENYPLIGKFSGNSLPHSLSTSAGTGAMCITFNSDNDNNDKGWAANYTSIVGTPTCSGYTLLANPSGTLNDGSGASNYGNNQTCVWHIAPPCAASVTLTFTQFSTEQDYDSVTIYDGSFTRINSYSGTTLPSSITTNTGELYIVFKTDFANNSQGWAAKYSSNSAVSEECSGNISTPSTTTLNTTDYGSITDGSGTNNYCNNRDCRWLIQPPQATIVTLRFLSFDVEDASSDGNSIYDAVEVYDGATTSATLLGRFTGNTIPSAITSSKGSLLVRFFTDNSNEKSGWSAYYTSTSPSACNQATTLTSTTGTISDGSGLGQYANNSDCSWLIQPANASKITLCFSDFNTEPNNDGVIIYDGATTSSTVLAVYTGTSLPANVTSTGGSMLVRFLSDESGRFNGWSANYASTPSVTANGPLNTCQGAGLVLTSSSSSNNKWYNNSNPIGSANSNTFTPPSSGSYTVSTILNNCTSTPSSPVVVTIRTPANEICGNGIDDDCDGIADNVFRFTGNGNFSNSSNWECGLVPANPLPAKYMIMITPQVNGKCIMDIQYKVSAGAKLTVTKGSNLILPNNLKIE